MHNPLGCSDTQKGSHNRGDHQPLDEVGPQAWEVSEAPLCPAAGTNTDWNQGPPETLGSLHEEKVKSDALPKVIPDLQGLGLHGGSVTPGVSIASSLQR